MTTISDVTNALVQEFCELNKISEHVFKVSRPSSRRWTRGDGSTYYDPGYIHASPDLIQKFWDWIGSNRTSRSLNPVTDWMGSSKPSDAKMVRGVVFVNRGLDLRGNGYLEFMSRGRLANKNSLYQQTKPADTGRVNESVRDILHAIADAWVKPKKK